MSHFLFVLLLVSCPVFLGFFLDLFYVSINLSTIYPQTTNKIYQVLVKWQWHPKTIMKVILKESSVWNMSWYMCSIQRDGTEEGSEDDRGYIPTMILLPERLISRLFSSIMKAMFLFCCSEINESPLAARKNVDKKFIVKTIKKVNNMKVKFMIPKLLEYILRSIFINHA